MVFINRWCLKVVTIHVTGFVVKTKIISLSQSNEIKFISPLQHTPLSVLDNGTFFDFLSMCIKKITESCQLSF